MNGKNKLPRAIKVEKARRICELYSKGEYTIAACCQVEGIEYSTFQGWAQPNLSQEDIINGNYRRGFVQVVHDLYKGALVSNESNYKVLLKNATREGILKRANGMTYVEVHTEANYDMEGNSIGATVKRIERYLPPDLAALILLANCLGLTSRQAQAMSV